METRSTTHTHIHFFYSAVLPFVELLSFLLFLRKCWFVCLPENNDEDKEQNNNLKTTKTKNKITNNRDNFRYIPVTQH